MYEILKKKNQFLKCEKPGRSEGIGALNWLLPILAKGGILSEAQSSVGRVTEEFRRDLLSKGSLKNPVMRWLSKMWEGEITEEYGKDDWKAEVKTSVMSRKYSEFQRTVKHHVRFTQTKGVYASPCVWDSGIAFKVVLYSLGFRWSSPWLKKHVKMQPRWLQWVGLHGCLWRRWRKPLITILAGSFVSGQKDFSPEEDIFFGAPSP